MVRRALLAASLAIVMAVPAFAQQKAAAPAASDDPIVAKINGQVLHRSDLQQALHGAPQQVQQAPFEQIYPQLLNRMAAGVLLAQAGRKAKLDANPAVKAQIALAETEILADAYIASLSRTEITEAKLRAAYDEYVKTAPAQDEVSARHILVTTEQEAKDIIAQLNKGADFATLAKDKTTDASGKASGGDLGFFTRQDMVPEFANAAFALKKGEFTQTPVHTQFGWHVIKVEDRRSAKPTYEQVAPQLAQQMQQKMIDEKLQELKSQGKIELFDMNGKPVALAAPPAGGAKPAPTQSGAAPVLTPPNQAGATGGAADAPTLSPATAPDQLQH